MIVAAALVGLIAGYLWSSAQPVRYEGVVRAFLDTASDQAEPGRNELEKRLMLDATPQQAAQLANMMVRAYRDVLAQQANQAAGQEADEVARRQRGLESEIDTLSGQHRDDPSNPRLLANRTAKEKQLNELADQVEAVRRDAEMANGRAEALQETAGLPEEPAAPKPLRDGQTVRPTEAGRPAGSPTST